ncbi:YhjD/YihY/BrkB family envelope integrity protein [Streptomyces sp. NPDC048441]|uniref:YhjD/YihY/BrkB family envelope integrity protein n=1 Tax=Streptomyces sp. NPDC048441 TaxID=3365552 RepID=UPI00371070C6
MPPASRTPEHDGGSARHGQRFPRLHRGPLASVVGLAWNRGREMELMHRAMGFAALSFLTLVPLLVVVAAADLARGEGFARWLVQGLGVSEVPEADIERLFGVPGKALQRTTALGLAALAAFGVTFGSAVQTGYERVWGLPPARWHTMWRHVVWLAVLVFFLLLFVTTLAPKEPSGVGTVLVAVGDTIGVFLFFWWSQRLLLCGRLRWRALAPGAAATAFGLLGLRIFSQFVFSPLIASNAATYGPFGTVLILQSWLVGVGFVVYGGALVGRLAHEQRLRRGLTADESN